jgi:methionyl-tRNA formyltransferase
MDYASGRLRPVPQAGEGTYAEKISREDARLDWNRSAEELERAVRAFNPCPGAWTIFRGKVLKVHRARRIDGSGEAGTFTDTGGRLLAAAAEACWNSWRCSPSRAVQWTPFVPAGGQGTPGS